MEKIKKNLEFNVDSKKKQVGYNSRPKPQFKQIDKKDFFSVKKNGEEINFQQKDIDSELIYGMNSIKQCLLTKKSLSKIFLDKNKNLDQELLSLIKNTNISLTKVPREKLDSLTKGNHQGIVGFISPIDFLSEEDLLRSLRMETNAVTIIILNGVTDVRNIGAIIRTAACVGAVALVLDQGCGRINNEAVHTSAGAIFEVKICKVKSLGHFINLLSDLSIEIIACSEKTESNIFSLNLENSVAFLFGSEGSGIEKRFLSAASKIAKIPMMGSVSSLNVSVAASIAMYESLRQRMAKSLT